MSDYFANWHCIVAYIIGKNLFIYLYNDVQLVRIMHLWDEQHS